MQDHDKAGGQTLGNRRQELDERINAPGRRANADHPKIGVSGGPLCHYGVHRFTTFIPLCLIISGVGHLYFWTGIQLLSNSRSRHCLTSSLAAPPPEGWKL